MSLSDRLGRVPAPSVPEGGPAYTEAPTAPVSAIPIPVTGAGYIRGRNGRRVYDPLAPVRRRAHQALLDQRRDQPQHRALGCLDALGQLGQGHALGSTGGGHQIEDRQGPSQR